MRVSHIQLAVLVMALTFFQPAANGGGTHVYETEMTSTELVNFDNTQASNGRVILDIEMRWDGSQIRYSGIWGEVPGGGAHGVAGVDATTWQAFVNDMDQLDGRWVDVEVGYFNGQKRWAGVFAEDGDNYAYEIRTTLTEAQFEDKLDENLWAGRQIVDFECYSEGGNNRFAAVWVDDPNQPKTSLYYHLTFAQVDDLVNPQYPIDPATGLAPIPGIAGQVIDFERYYSELHGEYRYALIVSNHYSEEQWLQADLLSNLDSDDALYSDANTQIVDLDVYSANGQLYYLGVWSRDVKSLNEVAGIPSDPDPQPLSNALVTTINNFEVAQPNATIGLYAKNVRTNQSIAYNAGRPFYLASTSKVPMHVRLWQLDEDGTIDLDVDTMAYSTSNADGNPWYVDNRDPNGLGPADFGQSFTLEDLDADMVQLSDNAATSMLLEMQIGRMQMNNWMAELDGIAAGFHPITAITDLDRLIMWQGQVNNFPSAQSFWFIPSWIWEPWAREGGDTYGWFQNFVGNGNSFPSVSVSTGERRYFRMGLNSAEPRAFGLLQERLAQGNFFNTAQRTTDCINVFGSGTPLDDVVDGSNFLPGMPPVPAGEQPTTRAKNGGKGNSNNGTRVTNDTALFQKGPDTIVMCVFTQGGSLSGTTIRNTYMRPIGYELYANLISDLTDAGPNTHFVSDVTVYVNQSWNVLADVANVRPGDATPYKVRFYASDDPIIDPNTDYYLGQYQTPTNHPGNTDATVGLFLDDFPNIPSGTYFIGWVIDALNEVGEWDDRNADNIVLLGNADGSLVTITVSPPTMSFDSNDDGSIDMLDLAAFQACYTGPNVPVSRECDWANADGDGRLDADLDDLAILTRCMSGPGKFLDPDCVEGPID